MFQLFSKLLPFFFFCSAGTVLSQVDFSDAGTLTFSKTLLKKYPETEWLLAADVQATLQGDTATPNSSWSVQILAEQRKTPRHCIEFERTVMSTLILHAFIQGGDEAYAWFVQKQKTHALSRKSFDEIVSIVSRVTEEYGLELLEANLIFGDLGKTPEARRRAKEHGILEGDHDIFLSLCLQNCPEIFPSFDRKKHAVIQKYAGLIHFGHLWHVEGTAQKMMGHLKNTGIIKTPKSFDFEYVTHICDIAAVLGHVSHEGSLILTEDAFSTMQEAMEAIKALATESPNNALQVYLDLRAHRIGLGHVIQKERNILARLAAMMRLRVKDDALGEMLLTAWQGIPQKEDVLTFMNPLSDVKTPTPTYVPAVLGNIQDGLKKAGASPQEAMNQAIRIALPWMIQVMKHYRAVPGITLPPNLTLNFNAVGGAVREDLRVLDNNPPFQINPETGLVSLTR